MCHVCESWSVRVGAGAASWESRRDGVCATRELKNILESINFKQHPDW